MTNLEGLIWKDNFPYFRLRGDGTRDFLQGQTTADLRPARIGGITKTCWLSRTGKVRAILEISFNSSGADVIVLAGNGNEIFNEFESVIFPADKVKLDSYDQILRVQKLTLNKSWKDIEINIFKSKEDAENSFRGYKNATRKDIQIWRIKQGMPFGNREINGKNDPFELGLADLVSIDKGCYLGQEVIARMLRQDVEKKKISFFQVHNISSKYFDPKYIFGEPLTNLNSDYVGLLTSFQVVRENLGLGLGMVKANYLNEKYFYIDERKIKLYLLPLPTFSGCAT